MRFQDTLVCEGDDEFIKFSMIITYIHHEFRVGLNMHFNHVDPNGVNVSSLLY